MPLALIVSNTSKSPFIKLRVFEANLRAKNKIITYIHKRYALIYKHYSTILLALPRMPLLSHFIR